MLSENVRALIQTCAWLLILVGILMAVTSGLRQFGVMSPPIVNVNGNVFSTILSLVGMAVGSVVQGGVVLLLVSIDERIK